MSASSKKRLRKEQEAAKMTEKQLTAQKEAKKVNLYTTCFVAVMAVLLVVAIVVGVNQTITNSGMREKNTVALTVGDHEINSVEMNYFFMDAVNNFYSQYGSMASFFGLDLTKPLNEQIVNEETGLTWADDFLASAKSNAKAVYAMADAAEAAGFQLSNEELTEIEYQISNMNTYANMYGYADADAYLQAMYGKGADTESFTAYAKLTALASAYYNAYAESLTYTDADLRAKEAENFNAYSSYSFNTYYLSTSKFRTGGTTDEEGNTTYTDAETAAAEAAAEEAAKVLTAEDITSIAALDDAIAALPINNGTTASSTANTNTMYANVNGIYADWLTDAARKTGDKAYFASTSTDAEGNETVSGYYVVYFLESNDNTMPLANVRHILVSFEGGTTNETTGATVYSDEEKAAAKAAAEEILNEWKSGAADEAFFAELANAKSADGDGTTGGLYENVYPGQMVANFNDWCFDDARASGDTGIVETEYGYHVMYYVGESDMNYRDFQIENALRSADASAWYTETVDALSVTDGDTKFVMTDLVLSNG